MTVYIGKPGGALIELPYVTSQSVEAADRYTLEETLEGAVQAQVRSLGLRAWSLSATRFLAEAQGILGAFASGEWGDGPFVWVATDAPVTNLLTPEASTCGPGARVGAHVSPNGGPMALEGGGWAGRSYTNSDLAQNMQFGAANLPLPPSGKVTGSVTVLGVGARAGINFYRADGSLSTITSGAVSTATGNATTPKRLSVTADRPADAVAARVYANTTAQACRPAFTWTDRMFDWADGQGCDTAVIHGITRDVQAAHRDPRGYRATTMAFRATEVRNAAG